MGLSGRKTKQRIDADPRNLTWADDAAKFGSTYLAKLGWDPSKGLGASGEGRTSHIKVAQKLNMLGIGAGAQPGGKDGVAWKQNRDYELLLKRLNDTREDEEEEEPQEVENIVEEAEGTAEEKGMKKRKCSKEEDDSKKKRKKEKKATKADDSDDGKEEKKKRKDGKKKRKSKDKGKTKSDSEVDDEPAGPSEILNTIPSSIPTDSKPPTPVARPKAHRARFLRSKQLASRSSSAVAEILGISPSASAAESAFTTRSSTPALQADQELTTATQSVGDYFKAKLAARALGRMSASTPSGLGSKVVVADSSTITTVAERYSECASSVEGVSRAGLGSRSGLGLSSTLNSPADVTTALGSGLKFGSLMGRTATPVPIHLEETLVPLSGSDVPDGDLATSTDAGNVNEGEDTKKKKKDKDREQRKQKKYEDETIAEGRQGEKGLKKKKKRRTEDST